MKLSCGVIIIQNKKILLGHATGQSHWDLPKGSIDEGESRKDCAIRETQEETGLILLQDQLCDCGEFEYKADKRLHLFKAINLPNIDTKYLKCTSFFENKLKMQVPEFDAFSFFDYEDLEELPVAKSMRKLMYTLKDRGLI